VCDAEANLLRSSARVSCACSITVSSAGCRFTRGPAVSTTSHLSKREPIDRGRYHSVGAEAGCTSDRAYSTVLQFINICYFSGFLTVSFYFYYFKEVNIFYCLAFQRPVQWLFYSFSCFEVELFVVKICIICTPGAFGLIMLTTLYAMFNHLHNIFVNLC